MPSSAACGRQLPPKGKPSELAAAPWEKPLELTGAFSPWGRRCPRLRPRTDEGRACGYCPLKGDHANSALISRLRAAASVYALRAAFGGCAPTRACGRSPSGKPLELAAAPRGKPLEVRGVTMGKYKIFVDGSSGTTGLRIADRLAERDEFEILKISEADRKDVRARAEVINESDLSFLCLPDDAAREVVPLLRDDVRILDTSTAHRTAPGWVYGLPELHGTREALKTATRVAVPGCHATGFIAPVAPLVELGILPKAAHLNVTSLTGYSGGGKKMIAEYEAERTNKALNAPRPYGLALHHKHLPEMAVVTGLDTAPNFVPVVADYYAGMETMIPLDVTALGVSAPQVASALAEYYAGQPMIKVHPLCEGTDGGFLAANKLAGKDTLEIYCLANPDGTRMQLISLFDNLGKGSSGAAVQCMNLMLGLEETKGLAR